MASKEFIAVYVFEHITIRTAVHELLHHGTFTMLGKGEHFHIGHGAFDAYGGLHAVHHGHVYIHQHDVHFQQFQ
jgi:hypothetical protein